MIRIMFIAAFCLSISAASAQSTAPRNAVLSEDMPFCPSWAEAHERTMAGLNNEGRRPSGSRWKGCIVIKKGTEVEVIQSDDQQSEIVYKKKHWFSDQAIF